MLNKQDVVYKLDLEDRKPVLRFVVISTRKIATHDEAADLPDIPDIFVPTSIAGMSQAVWKASCLPMRAVGAMFDAGYNAFEDIDRLDEFASLKAQEEKTELFNEIMKAYAQKLSECLKEANDFKGPWPTPVAHAIITHNEYERRKRLAAQKMKAEAEAAGTA